MGHALRHRAERLHAVQAPATDHEEIAVTPVAATRASTGSQASSSCLPFVKRDTASASTRLPPVATTAANGLPKRSTILRAAA